MQVHIMDWSTMHTYGDLWYRHLNLRKKVFIDGLGWDVPHSSRAEWDQYDTDFTTYFVVTDNSECVASARVMPTDCPLSYMILDAQEGKLAGIPPNIISKAPRSREVWEATRFAISPGADDPGELQKTLVTAMIAWADSNHIRQLIALMPLAVYRGFRGYAVIETEPAVVIDGRKSAVGWLDVRRSIAHCPRRPFLKKTPSATSVA